MYYLYLIKSEDLTKFKIGITESPDDRIIKIENTCKFKIDYENSIKFEIGSKNQMKNLEYCLHIFFDKYNIKHLNKNFYSKEWFDIICYNDVLNEIIYFKERNFKISNPIKFNSIKKSKNGNSIWKEKYGFSKEQFKKWNKKIIESKKEMLNYYGLYSVLINNKFEYSCFVENEILEYNIVFENKNPFYKKNIYIDLLYENKIEKTYVCSHFLNIFFGLVDNSIIFRLDIEEDFINIKFNIYNGYETNNSNYINNEIVKNKIDGLNQMLYDASKNYINH